MTNDLQLHFQLHMCQSFSAALTENFLVFSFQEKPKLIYVNLGKKPGLDGKKMEKLSALEVKVLPLDK